MKPEGLLLQSEEPATCPCPEPDQSSPYSPNHFLNIHFHFGLPCTPESSNWFLSSSLATKTLNAPLLSPIRAKCAAHLFLLDLITQITFGEEYRA